MKKTVLIVEDGEEMSEVIGEQFSKNGFQVTFAGGTESALELLEYNDYDIILLDLALPEVDGFSVCRKIRKNKDTPIVMLTAGGDEDDKLIGYEMGIDDYVTKPFSPKLLVAKANALIKRSKGNVCTDDSLICASGIVINNDSHTVLSDGEYIALTPKEYDLLSYMILNRGKVLSRDTLLSHVWGYDYFGDLRTVDTHIKKLRAKLGKKSVLIKTLIKAGYKFDENASGD